MSDEGLSSGLEKIEYCEDGHRCLNGSVCISDPADETAYLCDCSVIGGNNPHTGRYCEFGATSICHEDGAIMDVPIYDISFCTNGGTCNDILAIAEGHIHQGCNCPPDYSGNYCEYPVGTEPDAASNNGNNNSSSSSGMHDTLVGMLVFIILICVAAFALLAYRRVRKQQLESDVAKMDDLVMRSGTDAVVRGESSMPSVEELKGFPAGAGDQRVQVTQFGTTPPVPIPEGPPPPAPDVAINGLVNGSDHSAFANEHSNGNGHATMVTTSVSVGGRPRSSETLLAEEVLAISLAADVDDVVLSDSEDAGAEGEFVNGDNVSDNEII